MIDFPRQYAITRRFTLGVPRTLRVLPEGAGVLFLRSGGADDPVLGLWRLDLSEGHEVLVVDPSTLGGADDDLPAAERARRERARESSAGIVAYSVDAAGTRAAFALGGDLYVVDLSMATAVALPTGGAVFDPVIDPTGRRVGYVGPTEDGATGLFVVDTDASSPSRLVVGDPDPLVSWGRAEFVAGEEMSRTRGMWWSPDGSRLIAERVAEHDVDVWWIGDPAHPSRTPQPIRYPAAGTANASVGLTVFDIDGAADPVDLDWSDGGRFEYLADVVWARGHDPLVVRQTRDQRTVEIVEWTGPDVDPIVRRVIVDDTWVELVPGSPTWSGARLLTVEDTATSRRLHVDGVPLTPEHMQVRSIAHADDATATLTISLDDPTSVHVVTVALADGAVQVLTETPGVHGVLRSGGTIVLTSAGVGRHTNEIVVSYPGGTATIADRGAVPVLSTHPLFRTVGAGELRSAVFLPAGHDGAAPLPVLLDPYGGPHAQRVLQTNNAHLVSQWFADQGFAVVVTDGRGTPGRGPAFERAVWGDLAAPVLDDQIEALDALADEFSFLDLDRVGIRGWSFGGYLAALAVLRRPDRFHAAVAGAPVTDWRLYDTHYTERYLGTPQQYPQHYERCDLSADAAALRRPLLLVHGLADDNVVAAHTLRLSTALLANGRQHQVLPLSGVTHMTPQEAVAENLLRLQFDFLAEHLGVARVEG